MSNRARRDLHHPLAINSYRHWRRLARYGGGVDAAHRPIARHIARVSLFWAPLRYAERVFVEPKVAATEIKHPPIFVIGHWRTGTTHLHNLLSLDPTLAYVSTFQTLAPECSVLGHRTLRPLVMRNMPPTRPMDNMPLGADLPQEEEFAVANRSLCSMYAGFYFPQKFEELFDKFGLFNRTSESEKAEWERVYRWVLQKATLLGNGKRLVLKNPVNTGRIPELLALFPDAKFIHIHRSPYEVYNSTRKLYQTVLDQLSLQSFDAADVDRFVVTFYRGLLNRLFATREQVPPGNYAEVAYNDLIERPQQELARLYAELALPSYAETRPYVDRYLDRQRGYQPNQFQMAASDIATVEDQWAFALDRWSYPRPQTT